MATPPVRRSERRKSALAALLGVVLAACAHASSLGGPEGWAVIQDEGFSLAQPSQVVAAITASCARCDWGTRGREAAVLSVSVDGRYSQDLPLVQGPGPAVYRVSLGGLESGRHRLGLAVDPLSAPGARGAQARVEFRAVPAGAADHLALSHAPVLHQRLNAVGGFTDVPLLMYYESEPTPAGTLLRYTVIFSNEDGGTPPDRLMATWGRVTDIELVYEVEVDRKGAIVRDVFQGPDHKMLAFAGQREGRHPLLWVVTDNNMVSDRGQTRRCHRPAPERVELKDVSREAVMDAHPWTYRVMAEEVRREGRVHEGAYPGSEKVPDLRRFTYVEACGEVQDAVLAFDLGLAQAGGTVWAASDGGDPRYRVARSGCFRAAVAVPPEATLAPPEAVRFRAHTRPPRIGEVPLPPGTGTARLTRVNRVFRLGEDHTPGPDLLRWTGEAPLPAEGAPLELPLR